MPGIDLVQALRRGWYLVVIGGISGALLAFFMAFAITPIYRAETVLAPIEIEGGTAGLGALMGQFGGLASLAGVQLPRSGNQFAALETLRSRTLTESLIRSMDLMPVLFEKRWNAQQKRWRDDDPPTMNEALLLFDRRIRFVDANSKDGILRLGIEWTDPDKAAKWANMLVDLTNRVLREREIQDAEHTIAALTLEVDKASNIDVRAALYRIIESQLKSKAVASGREQFAFRVIDPAIAPDADKPIWPPKALLGLLGLFLGSVLAVLVCVMREAKQRS